MSPPEERKTADDPLQRIAAMLPSNSHPSSFDTEAKLAIGEDETGVRRFALRFYMRNKREEWGLSKRQAAKQCGISEARWRQLEAGYQLVGGQKMPVKATEQTVLRIASGMNMNPDVALQAAGKLGDRHVRVAETGVWPLPKTADSNVASNTLKRATVRLRELERICQQITKLPLKDLEFLKEFIDGFVDDAYTEQALLEEQHQSAMARLERGYDDGER